jgi:methylenetetrahydrofolate reductase (NADPH)
MNKLRQAIANHDFLITAEVAPPKGADPHHMVEMAQILNPHVHAINITDGSRAVMRMSSLAAALILQNQGIEAICQVTCRDRNRIGLQSDLLGAQALGIRTVLALTGDPVKAGDQPDARPVFDLESVRLIQLIHNLNQGLDYNAKALPDGATDLLIGAAVDPQLPNLESLQKRFERKLNAGAQFFQSQLITDFDRLEQFMVKIAAGQAPILAGIFLLKSAKNAEFINRYVPGVQIPQTIIDRLAKSDSPLQEGIAIAAEQVRHAKQLCQGVHMMAVNREDLIPEILAQAGLAQTGLPQTGLSQMNSHPAIAQTAINR